MVKLLMTYYQWLSLVSKNRFPLVRSMDSKSPQVLWSAAPTPLTPRFEVDLESVERMVRQARTDRLDGLFLAGTCGEGMCLPNRERKRLIRAAVDAAEGKLHIAAQVSDNSAPRIRANLDDMADAGAGYGIIAPPTAMINASPARIVALYEEAIASSPLPIGIYDLGARQAFALPDDALATIYALPGVKLVKDSSADPKRRAHALAARRRKPGLQLLNGDEFKFIDYLEAGYDGALFGGAAVVAPFMHRIAALFAAGRGKDARAVDARMQEVLYGIYGGRELDCWLTGLKYYLQRAGQFSTTASFFGYPLTDECRVFIDRCVDESLESRLAPEPA